MKLKKLRPNSLLFALSTLVTLVAGCAHQEPVADALPAWMTATSRTVDGDHIYYVASADSKFLDRARLDAEGAALEDIANECSFVPTTVKRENENASDDAKTIHTVKAQYSVPKADCLKAQSTFSPDEIRIFANVAATQKILKHQDLTGESSDPTNGAQDPVQAGDINGLIFARQQIALRKQAVILSVPTHYRLHSPDSKRFYQKIKTDSDPVIALGKQSEALTMTSSWSSTHQKSSDAIPVPVLSSDSPSTPASAATPLPSSSGKRKGPKASPKSFPKN